MAVTSYSGLYAKKIKMNNMMISKIILILLINCNDTYIAILCTKDGKQFCKFEYIKESIKRTFVRDDNHSQLMLIMAKNDLLINLHSQL